MWRGLVLSHPFRDELEHGAVAAAGGEHAPVVAREARAHRVRSVPFVLAERRVVEHARVVEQLDLPEIVRRDRETGAFQTRVAFGRGDLDRS